MIVEAFMAKKREKKEYQTNRFEDYRREYEDLLKLNK